MTGTSRNRAANRLTVLAVKSASEPGVLEDGAGLRLLVNENGQKHWVVRVTVAGQRITRGLGSFPDVSLSDARDKAEEARRGARNGVDATAQERQQIKSLSLTFRDALTRYL
jgi:Arm DNA-binding domain